MVVLNYLCLTNPFLLSILPLPPAPGTDDMEVGNSDEAAEEEFLIQSKVWSPGDAAGHSSSS